MAGNIQNVRIGDAEVYLDGVHQGHTKGGVELSFEREFEDLTVDQHGSSPIDMALTGHNLTIKAFLAEITPGQWKASVPEAPSATGDLGTKVGFGSDSGELLRQYAKQLRLHPRNKAADDYSEDVYIWLAVSSENVEQNYKIDEQRVFETTFRALVDDTKGDGFRLGQVGPLALS